MNHRGGPLLLTYRRPKRDPLRNILFAGLAFFCFVLLEITVLHRGMGTGISEASKRVPIFSFATQGGKQVSSYFGQDLRQGQELRQGGLNRLRFGSLLHDLSLQRIECSFCARQRASSSIFRCLGVTIPTHQA